MALGNLPRISVAGSGRLPDLARMGERSSISFGEPWPLVVRNYDTVVTIVLNPASVSTPDHLEMAYIDATDASSDGPWSALSCVSKDEKHHCRPLYPKRRLGKVSRTSSISSTLYLIRHRSIDGVRCRCLVWA